MNGKKHVSCALLILIVPLIAACSTLNAMEQATQVPQSQPAKSTFKEATALPLSVLAIPQVFKYCNARGVDASSIISLPQNNFKELMLRNPSILRSLYTTNSLSETYISDCLSGIAVFSPDSTKIMAYSWGDGEIELSKKVKIVSTLTGETLACIQHQDGVVLGKFSSDSTKNRNCFS